MDSGIDTDGVHKHQFISFVSDAYYFQLDNKMYVMPPSIPKNNTIALHAIMLKCTK